MKMVPLPPPLVFLVPAEASTVLKAAGFELAFTVSIHANGPFLFISTKHSISLRVNIHFPFTRTTHPIL